MSRVLSVSVSGYYAWLHRKPSARLERDKELSKKIKAILMMRNHELESQESLNA
nr:hypothetical protein [Legionella brunensis]